MSPFYVMTSRVTWQVYAVTSFVFVLTSIAGFTLETTPQMYSFKNVTRRCAGKEAETVPILENHPVRGGAG